MELASETSARHPRWPDVEQRAREARAVMTKEIPEPATEHYIVPARQLSGTRHGTTPAGAPRRKLRLVRGFLTVLLLLSVVFWVLPAQAQTPAPSPPWSDSRARSGQRAAPGGVSAPVAGLRDVRAPGRSDWPPSGCRQVRVDARLRINKAPGRRSTCCSHLGCCCLGS